VNSPAAIQNLEEMKNEGSKWVPKVSAANLQGQFPHLPIADAKWLSHLET